MSRKPGRRDPRGAQAVAAMSDLIFLAFEVMIEREVIDYAALNAKLRSLHDAALGRNEPGATLLLAALGKKVHEAAVRRGIEATPPAGRA
jgi:hypothetical protein